MSGKASIVRFNGAGGSIRHSDLFSGLHPLRKFLSSKELLDWLKIDLNATKIITVQDYKRRKN